MAMTPMNSNNLSWLWLGFVSPLLTRNHTSIEMFRAIILLWHDDLSTNLFCRRLGLLPCQLATNSFYRLDFCRSLPHDQAALWLPLFVLRLDSINNWASEGWICRSDNCKFTREYCQLVVAQSHLSLCQIASWTNANFWWCDAYTFQYSSWIICRIGFISFAF